MFTRTQIHPDDLLIDKYDANNEVKYWLLIGIWVQLQDAFRTPHISLNGGDKFSSGCCMMQRVSNVCYRYVFPSSNVSLCVCRPRSVMTDPTQTIMINTKERRKSQKIHDNRILTAPYGFVRDMISRIPHRAKTQSPIENENNPVPPFFETSTLCLWRVSDWSRTYVTCYNLIQIWFRKKWRGL